MGDPGNLQLVNVLFVNLVEGGETVAVGGVAPVRPVFLLLARGDRFNRHRLAGADQRLGFKHPAETTQQYHRQHRCQAKRWPFIRRLPGQKRPDQRGKEGQYAEREQAREQRPVGPAGIANGPDDRGDKRYRVQYDTAATAAENEHRGDNHHQAHNRKIEGPANGGELCTKNTDSQANDQHQPGEKPLQDPGESSRRVASCHFFSLTTPEQV